ncbi:MAG: protein kinase domain-containing protein, partial [Tepidiformaceae bacterium]
MPSERIVRRVARVLDEAESAADRNDWAAVGELARQALALDETSEDARALLSASERMGAGAPPPATTVTSTLPASFAAGRYAVRRFLGEGGRKRVFLAHDTRLDREVAFCSIRTDGLDDQGRHRVLREAQSMARLAHPNLVVIHDIGEDSGNPFIVQEFMDGGDVASLLAS